MAFASYGSDLMSFDLTSGAANWSYSSAPAPVNIIASAIGNTLVAKTTDVNGLDAVMRFDASGGATTETWTSGMMEYLSDNSLTGVSSGSTVSSYVTAPIQAVSIYFSPTMGKSNAARKFFSNFNQIEILTSASADAVFNDYLRTFRGVADATNSVGIATQNGVNPTNLTGVGQTVTFAVKGAIGLVQGPFDVTTVRFSPATRTLVAETVNIPSNYHGHPLYGWRYWRVYERAPGNLIVETGALVMPTFEIDPFLGTAKIIAFALDGLFFQCGTHDVEGNA